MRTRLILTCILLATVSAGGCATAPKSEGSPDSGTPTSTAMTVGECKNLGCNTVEAANCPAIIHDFGTRHWACKCAGGSSCITENSPQ